MVPKADKRLQSAACTRILPGLSDSFRKCTRWDSAGDSGLKDLAEPCRRDFAARPARDRNEVRDQLLLIGIEWNLDCDRLDRQSDACLRTVAAFLR